MTPFFSIIIPTYNAAATLPRAVVSVLTQLNENDELIIINDGSTDNTAELLSQYSNQSSQVRILNQTNKGAASARNQGVKNSQGQYILFLDADDALMPEALVILRNVLSARPHAQVVIGAYIKVDTQGKEKYCGNAALSKDPEKRFADYLDKKLSISSGATLFARAVFDKLQFPEQCRAAEDIPLFAQAIALFYTVGIEEPLVKIYSSPTSLRHDAQAALSVGLTLVDVLFNPEILNPQLMQYRHAFFVRRCLSLCRTLSTAGEYQQARYYYFQAVKADWKVLLKPEYWGKLFSL